MQPLATTRPQSNRIAEEQVSGSTYKFLYVRPHLLLAATDRRQTLTCLFDTGSVIRDAPSHLSDLARHRPGARLLPFLPIGLISVAMVQIAGFAMVVAATPGLMPR